MNPATLLGVSPEDDGKEEGDPELRAFTEPHLLQLETYDHSSIEVECTGAVRRPPPDCVLSAPGDEQLLLLQFSVELDESAIPSPVEGRRSNVQVVCT